MHITTFSGWTDHFFVSRNIFLVLTSILFDIGIVALIPLIWGGFVFGFGLKASPELL